LLSPLIHTLSIAILAGSWAFSGYVMLPAGIRRTDFLMTWGSALALGAGASSVLLTALAALHALTGTTTIAVAVSTGLVAFKGARGALQQWPASQPRGSRRPYQSVALVALGAVVLLTLFVTLAPPSSMDATVYHLRVPREFLRAHTWLALEDVHSYQPLYVEMLFGEGLVLGGGVLAALVHWALGLGAIAVAGAWGRRLGGSAIWAAVIFGTTGLYVWESTSAFIDLGLTLFVSLAMLWATQPAPGRQSTVMSGIFAGLAAGSKFTGLLGALLTGVVLFATVWPDWRSGVRRLAIFGAIAGALAAPWYVRNAVFTGNPIYPLANRLLGLPHVLLSAVPYGFGSDVLHLLTSPFDLLARGAAFDQGWAVGPAYLALAPLGIVVSRRSQIALIAALIILLWWLVWFFSSPQTRLLLPILPLAAGLASVGISAALSSQRRSLEAGALAVVAISVLGGLGSAGLYAVRTAKVVLGLQSSTRYLEDNSWNYPAYENVDRLVPLNASIAVEGANNLYYLSRPARFFLDPTPTVAELQAGGFTHLLKIDGCPPVQAGGHGPDLWSGEYDLRASRARGGVLAHLCARLMNIASPRSPDATAP
jgi:hypothetical protein